MALRIIFTPRIECGQRIKQLLVIVDKNVLFILYGQQNNFRRNTKSHGQNTCPNPRRHKQVMAIFKNMSTDVLLTVVRRLNDRPNDRKPNLSTVSMSCEKQRNPFW